MKKFQNKINQNNNNKQKKMDYKFHYKIKLKKFFKFIEKKEFLKYF